MRTQKKWIVQHHGGCSHFDTWPEAAEFIEKELKKGYSKEIIVNFC